MSLAASVALRFRAVLDRFDAEDLRAVLVAQAQRLEHEAQEALFLELVEYAARKGKYEVISPGEDAATEAEQFALRAAKRGEGDPSEFDEHLRAGKKAFLARDYSCARRIFMALLEPLEGGEIYLGEDEMAAEVLSSDLTRCSAMALAATYLCAKPEDRATLVFDAIENLDGNYSLSRPIADMERVLAGPLPDLAAFLPAWLALLQGEPESQYHGGYARGSRIREAMARLEGPAGLERLARSTGAYEDLREWCDAVAATGDLSAAHLACDDAANICREPYHRANFLEASARLAHKLGDPAYRERIFEAWRAAPCPERLHCWLGEDHPSAAALRERAAMALTECRPNSDRERGILLLLTQEIAKAAKVLTGGRGLGWSSGSHPGHVVFAAMSWLLGDAPHRSLRQEAAEQVQPGRLPSFAGFSTPADDDDGPRVPHQADEFLAQGRHRFHQPLAIELPLKDLLLLHKAPEEVEDPIAELRLSPV